MNIDAVLTPAEIALLPQRDLSDATCIVFDVLRATSSMVTALAHGAAEIHPVSTIKEALALKRRLPDAILGGERSGDPIPGFDVGNSPREYRQGVRGRKIITTTTNGTVALKACAGARQVLIGALLNMDALAAAVQKSKNLLLVCAGTFDSLALEDVYAAGLLMGAIERDYKATDAAECAAAAGEVFLTLGAVRYSRNGCALAKAKRGADVKWCMQYSKYNVVGQMSAGVIRPLTA
jgi:2-phosphosulfolactate phosphatase